MVRVGKEYILNINDKICTKYGALNKNEPKVVYMNCKGWLTPKFESENYKTQITPILQNFKKSITKSLGTSVFHEKHISDFDLKISSLRKDKRTFISLDFFLKQKEDKRLEELKKCMFDLFKTPLDKLLANFEDNKFIIEKSKN